MYLILCGIKIDVPMLIEMPYMIYFVKESVTCLDEVIWDT